MFSPRQPFLQSAPSCFRSGGSLAPRFSVPPPCHPERRGGSAFSSSNFELSTVNLPSVTPFPATLANLPQVNENKTTLSLSFATLTSHATRKSFACHSCKKHPGWGPHPSNQVRISSSLLLPASLRARVGQPFLAVSWFLVAERSLVTRHPLPALFQHLTSNLQPPFCCIIPPHRGNTHNPLRNRGGFSD